MRKTVYSPILTLLIVAPVVSTGCSADRQIIHSTLTRPASVAIVDVAYKETLWAMDVPVRHSLVLDFKNKHDITGIRLADSHPRSVLWRLYPTADVQTAYIDRDDYNVYGVSVGSDTLELPPRQVRVEVTYRPPQEPLGRQSGFGPPAPQPAGTGAAGGGHSGARLKTGASGHD